jgi:hypothetical protein
MTAPTRPSQPQRGAARHRLSHPEVAAQLVSDILHHRVEEVKRTQRAAREAVTRRGRRRRLWWLGTVPLLLGLTSWNFARAARAPEVFTADERESSLRFQIYLASQGVEAYRQYTGRWPADLRAVGMGDEGFVYEIRDSIYSISDTSAAVPLTYRRGDGLAPFAAAFTELQRGRSGL